MRLGPLSLWAGSPRRLAVATFTAAALLVSLAPVVPVVAAPVDTTSTTGVHILTIPAPEVVFVHEGVEFIVDAPYSGSAIVGDRVALSDSLNQGEGLYWPGIGYPQGIGDDFPAGWSSMGVTDMNSAGTMVGSYGVTGGSGTEVRGFVWSDTGFQNIEPPGSVPLPATSVSGIAETGWITGSFFAEPGVCSSVVARCGFVGEPTEPGFDFTVFAQPFWSFAIEYASFGGTMEHIVVGDQGLVWTKSGGIAELDDGAVEGSTVSAYDVNQFGQIVGVVQGPLAPHDPPPAPPPPPPTRDAAYWESPTSPLRLIRPLFPADGDNPRGNTIASEINNNGIVVGTGQTFDLSSSSGFYWNSADDGLFDLGHLPGIAFSSASSINDTGQVLGQSGSSAVIWDLTDEYEINYPPVIHLAELSAERQEGQLLQYMPAEAITNVEGDALDISWIDLPEGAAADPGTGVLSWQTDVGDAGTYTPTMVVSEADEPANTASAVVTLTVTVGPLADLQITVADPPTSSDVAVDDPVPFEFVVGNLGPETATGVVATVDLPAGTSVSALDSGCTYPVDGSKVECELSSLDGFHPFTFTANFPTAGDHTIDFTVDADQHDPDPSNNAAGVDLRVSDPLDLLDPIGDRSVFPLVELSFNVTSSAGSPAYRVRWLNGPVGEASLELPDGMTLGLGSGDFRWTPRIGQAGTFYELEFTVLDLSEPGFLSDSEVIHIGVGGASLSGYVWADLDGDGVRAPGPTDPEPLMGGVTVYIDENNNGHLDADEAVTRSSDNGTFGFIQRLPVGHELVIRQVVPVGFAQTEPPVDEEIRITLPVDGSYDVTGFGNVPDDLDAIPSVFGTVWNDTNCDGVHDFGELGLHQRQVYVDENENGRFDSGEATVGTDPAGRYSLVDLDDGTYLIGLLVPFGFEHTFPGNTSRLDAHSVTVDNGRILGGRDFGVAAFESCPSAIYGTLWHDIDTDGTIDNDENPLPGSFFLVWLDEDGDGHRNRFEPLGYIVGPGKYRFLGVDPGNHLIRSAVPVTYPIRTFPGGDHAHLATSADGETLTGFNFGFTAPDDPGNLPPVMEPISDQVAVVGNPLVVAPLVTDPEDDPFILSLGPHPPGAVINGIFSWTPERFQFPGTYDVTIRARQISDPNKVASQDFKVDVLDDGDDFDGDGIDNSIDGQGTGVGGFFSEFDSPSFDFTDQHRPGPSDGPGTTHGQIVSGEGWSISDAADPAQGVDAVFSATSPDEFGVVRFCDPPSETRLVPGTRSIHTCGSHTVEVVEGQATLITSDGAIVDVGAGSTVKLDDDGESVVIAVLEGEATVSVGDNTVVLDDEDPVLSDPGELLGDRDNDGLTGAEEALTGTDPTNPDSDGDGLVDGIDASWLIGHLNATPRDHFKRRWHKRALKLYIAVAAVAVNLGDSDSALGVASLMHKRIDGCGSAPDRNDWITDCESQIEFRELLTLYERGIATLPLPDPFD